MAAPAPVSIQVLTVVDRDLARAPAAATLTRADFLPPALVLCLQLAVGWVVGANPLVLLLAAAAIILVAYLVWSSSRATRAASADAAVAAQVRGRAAPGASATSAAQVTPPAPLGGPSPELPDSQSSAESSTDGASQAPQTRPASDLRWLWGTILRDPTPRSSRRDRS